jgi:hypothetical protein
MAKRTTVRPKAAADLAARAQRTAGTEARVTQRASNAKETAKALIDQVDTAEEGTHLANADEETAMRRAAVSPAARKAALDAGKKDPLEKWGDPDATPDQARRALGV